MSWPPVSSEDVAEQREREAEAQAQAHAEAVAAGQVHDARCHRGWLGEDDEGRPIPCYACRPHLRPDPGGRPRDGSLGPPP